MSSATVLLGSWAQAQEPAAEATPEQTPAPMPAVATEAQPQPATPAPPRGPTALPEAPKAREHVAEHRGFYLRMGAGPSLTLLDGYGPSGSDAYLRGAGNGGFLTIGGALTPGFVLAGTLQGNELGANFNGGPLEDATLTVNSETRAASRKATGGFGMVGALVDWYPNPRGGWHGGLSTGVGVVALKQSADDRKLVGLDFAGSVFGGYDWAIGRDWSLGLQLTASGGSKAKLKEGDSDSNHDSGYRLTPLSIGVQASVLYF